MHSTSTMAHPNVNPIIPGFAPDPSIVFVQDTFFLVTSSFHLFPSLPIYASKDLLTWQHIGMFIPVKLLLRKVSLKLNRKRNQPHQPVKSRVVRNLSELGRKSRMGPSNRWTLCANYTAQRWSYIHCLYKCHPHPGFKGHSV